MTTRKKTWTVLDILNVTTEYFKKNYFENPRLNAERLLSHVLNIDRVNLYLQFERILSNDETHVYRSLVKRRSENEPLQYIIGQTEFMGLPFNVNQHVLIPRPETELLVETVLDLQNKLIRDQVNIWDIGTGSGCIGISLAHFWPDCWVTATDNSDSALEIAETNAQLNEVQNILFKKHDILLEETAPENNTHIIVSNPPYISKSESANLAKEIVDYEPISALTDFKDGLEFYRRILALIDKLKGCKFVIIEMSGTQTENILSLVKSYDYSNIEIINDLNQIPRILKLSL
jgi:release factor glutamine methyltransferase